MKPNYTNIAKHYKITRQTASNMKKRVPLIYAAMVKVFLEEVAKND